MKPYFVRVGRPSAKLRLTTLRGDISSVSRASSVDSQCFRESIFPTDHSFQAVPSGSKQGNATINYAGSSESTGSNIIVEPAAAKNPTMVRQLINLGKRGAEIGAEGSWDDDNVANVIFQNASLIGEKQRKTEKTVLSKRRPTEWNKMLDAGRTKKVKVKAATNPIDNAFNPFQQFEEDHTSRRGTEWNKMLDAGRTKKVKVKTATNPIDNAFKSVSTI